MSDGLVRKGRGFAAGSASFMRDGVKDRPVSPVDDDRDRHKSPAQHAMRDDKFRENSQHRKERSGSRSRSRSRSATDRMARRRSPLDKEQETRHNDLAPRESLFMSHRYSIDRLPLDPKVPNVIAVTGLPALVDAFAANVHGGDCEMGGETGSAESIQRLLGKMTAVWEHVTALEHAVGVAVNRALAPAERAAHSVVRCAQLVRPRIAVLSEGGLAPAGDARPHVLVQMASAAEATRAIAAGKATLRGLSLAICSPTDLPEHTQPQGPGGAAGAHPPLPGQQQHHHQQQPFHHAHTHQQQQHPQQQHAQFGGRGDDRGRSTSASQPSSSRFGPPSHHYHHHHHHHQHQHQHQQGFHGGHYQQGQGQGHQGQGPELELIAEGASFTHGGAAITLSNTRKNAILITGKTTQSGALTSEALAALRARIVAQGGTLAPEQPAAGGAPCDGGAQPPLPPTTDYAMQPEQSAFGGATLPPPPPPLPGAPPLPPSMPEYEAGEDDGGMPPPPPPISNEADAVAAALAAASAISANFTGGGGGGGRGGAGGLPPGAGSAGIPLLGPSGTSSSAPFPGQTGGGGVQIGSTPAAAAGLLGPSGLMGLLAGIAPTRILVLLNAVGDSDLRNEGELADMTSDIAMEAAAAIAAAARERAGAAHQAAVAAAMAAMQAPPPLPAEAPSIGRLIAVRIPRPRPGASERADPILVRRARAPGTAEALAAAAAAAGTTGANSGALGSGRGGGGGGNPVVAGGDIGPLALMDDAPSARRTIVKTDEDGDGGVSSLGKGGRGGGGKGKGRGGGDGGAGGGAYGAIPTSARAFFERIFVQQAGGAGGKADATGTASGAVGLLTDAGATITGGSTGDRLVRQAAQQLMRDERAAAAKEDREERDAAAASGGGGGDTRLAIYGQTDAQPAPTAEELDRDPLAGRTRGLGRVFLEFSTSDSAVAAQKELSGRAFGGRILATAFAEEDAYAAGRLVDFATCRARE